jgi:hypothetical protein
VAADDFFFFFGEAVRPDKPKVLSRKNELSSRTADEYDCAVGYGHLALQRSVFKRDDYTTQTNKSFECGGLQSHFYAEAAWKS